MSKITGTTTINHSIRQQLKLSCSQYVVMDFLHTWKTKNKEKLFTPDDIWKAIGILDIGPELINLKQMGLINIDFHTMKFTIHYEWLNFFNVDEKFDELWVVFGKKGNKPTALNRYKIVTRKVSHDVLMLAAKKYIKYQDAIKAERQFRKGLDVWLNPQKNHWEDIVELPHEQDKPGVFKGEFFQG